MADVGLSQDYRDLLVCLADAGADFLIVGGWALALHGHGRATDDVDAARVRVPEQAPTLRSAAWFAGVVVSVLVMAGFVAWSLPTG